MVVLTRPHCPSAMDKRSVAELTVPELEELIRRAVKNSLAEVMVEFALEADVEAQIAYEAEINDLLRHELQTGGKAVDLELALANKVDD